MESKHDGCLPLVKGGQGRTDESVTRDGYALFGAGTFGVLFLFAIAEVVAW